MTVGNHGRPLRFLCAVTGGWIAIRVAFLWPTIDSVPALIRAVAPVAQAQSLPQPLPPSLAASPPGRPVIRSASAGVAPRTRARREPPLAQTRVALALPGLVRFGEPETDAPPPPILPGVPRPPAAQPARSRWSGSAWIVARPGAGIAPGVVGGQLGGSQAGVRIAFALDTRRRLALAGRITTPLGPGLREAAVGLEWQPTRLPLRIVAEERVALDDAKTAPAIGIVGGVGPLALGGGFRLEAYAQAGVIKRSRAEPYADGAARAAHPLGDLGKAKLAAGAGVWAAAQRGATRVDVGPVLTLDVPLARQPVRFALEYRARVAGDARPGSGVTLTLGTDI